MGERIEGARKTIEGEPELTFSVSASVTLPLLPSG